MKTTKKILALLLIGVLVLSFAGCERKQTVSGYYEGSDYVDTDDTTTVSTNNDTSSSVNVTSNEQSTGSDKTQSSNKTSSSNKGVDRNDNIWKINRDVKFGGSGNILTNLNFNGKTFKMLVHQENFTDLMEQQVKNFAKKYNCTIKIDYVNFEENLSVMATSLSAGKPYDIILCHSAFFPQVAIASLCQPLESSISEKDFASKYGEQGLNKEAMLQSSTWANHIYYTVDKKPSYLQLVYYNKLLIEDFGLEDPLELYKKGQWTYDKIYEYAKIVKNANQGVSFFDSTLLPPVGGDFYAVENNGDVKWYGANTTMANGYINRRKFQEVSSLQGSGALVDNIVSGKTICATMEAEKLVVFTKSLKESAALGKNLNNLGVVPKPLNSDGTYTPNAPIGYAAARGTDPKVAVALAVYLSNMQPSWTDNEIPALKANKDIFTGLYNKMSYKSGSYYFLSSDGDRIEEEIYSMYTEINNGGDIMKLLESYAPTVKSILEYNLEKQ